MLHSSVDEEMVMILIIKFPNGQLIPSDSGHVLWLTYSKALYYAPHSPPSTAAAGWWAGVHHPRLLIIDQQQQRHEQSIADSWIKCQTVAANLTWFSAELANRGKEILNWNYLFTLYEFYFCCPVPNSPTPREFVGNFQLPNFHSAAAAHSAPDQ